MKRLIITVTNRFVHPHLGGFETTMKEFEMAEAVEAEIYYRDMVRESDKSGGCMFTEINILTRTK